jgi:hypothetical protein
MLFDDTNFEVHGTDQLLGCLCFAMNLESSSNKWSKHPLLDNSYLFILACNSL